MKKEDNSIFYLGMIMCPIGYILFFGVLWFWIICFGIFLLSFIYCNYILKQKKAKSGISVEKTSTNVKLSRELNRSK